MQIFLNVLFLRTAALCLFGLFNLPLCVKAEARHSSVTAPVLSIASSFYNAVQAVNPDEGAYDTSIFYSLNGTLPISISTLGATPTALLNATSNTIDFLNDSSSDVDIVKPSMISATGDLNFDSASMTLNGSAVLSGSKLRLTDGGSYEKSSAFSNVAVNVQAFTNDFTFQLASPNADGFMFVMQNQGTTAIGGFGIDLGYSGIGSSAGVKFDLYDNSGEGVNSTGLYTGGAQPTIPATDLSPSGLDLHSGNIMRVHMSYDGTILTVTTTDTATNATATQTYTVDIPALVGGNTAYVGFTAGTGYLTATQDVLSWNYVPQTPTYVSIQTASMTLNGSAVLSGSKLRLTDGGSYEKSSAFSNVAVNVQAFTNDFTFQLASPNADGFMFVMQNQGTTAIGGFGIDLGYSGIGSSAGVKFDLYDNSGEGVNSTGLYTGGAQPTIPATDLSPSGLDLHSGNIMRVHMSYDGTILTVTTTDTATNATATQTYTVDIPALVGGNTAYVGFTAGTGYLTATQDVLSWNYVPQTPTYVSIQTASMTLNGSAVLSGSKLRLTDGGSYEKSSAFSNVAVNVQAFTNDFTFQLASPNADGFMFVMQNQGTTAIGGFGIDLGYSGIGSSAGVKFDLYDNSGEGVNSTGLYTGGAQPTIPATDLSPSGLDLHSGNIMRVHMSYDGTILTVTTTDTATNATATQTYTVDIPALVGGNTAYVGFTAGTGYLTATQDVLSWNYVPQTITSSYIAATLTAPIPGSQLTGSAVNFSFNPGVGNSNYKILIGSSAGRNDIYDGSSLANSPIVIAGIPTDGRTLYVRLLSGKDGTWRYNDYIYIAAAAPVYDVCTTWGDSLTQGNEDGSGITIATVLTSSGYCRIVNNEGAGGQTSTQIAIRQGGVTTTGTISGNTIPPSGSVPITFPAGFEVGTSQGPPSIPISMSGVAGTVSYNSDGTYSFTRSTPGAAIYSPPNSMIKIQTADLNAGFNLIWVGRNNYHNVSQVLSDVAGMVNNLPNPKHFLVLSVINSEYLFEWNSGGGDYDTLVSLNQALAAAYPNNYIDIRKLLVQAYDPTNAQDVLDFSHDVPPSSLRAIDFSFVLSVPLLDVSTCNFGTLVGGRYAWTFIVGNEKVLVTGTNGDAVGECVRGYASTIATTHSSGITIPGIDFLHLNGGGYTLVGNAVANWIGLHKPF